MFPWFPNSSSWPLLFHLTTEIQPHLRLFIIYHPCWVHFIECSLLDLDNSLFLQYFAIILQDFSVHVDKRWHPDFKFPRPLSPYPFLLCTTAFLQRTHVDSSLRNFEVPYSILCKQFFSPFSYYPSHQICTTISTKPAVPGFPILDLSVQSWATLLSYWAWTSGLFV